LKLLTILKFCSLDFKGIANSVHRPLLPSPYPQRPATIFDGKLSEDDSDLFHIKDMKAMKKWVTKSVKGIKLVMEKNKKLRIYFSFLLA
jgi:hypothetical protein